LVTGIAAVNFEYGAGDTGLKTVSTYGTSPAGVIGTVRYTILMQSPSSAGSIRDSAAQSAALKEWNGRFPVSVAETNQIYQLVQGTTMIRNQMP
jgi:type IV pilus assembly protein PilW